MRLLSFYCCQIQTETLPIFALSRYLIRKVPQLGDRHPEHGEGSACLLKRALRCAIRAT